MSIFVLSVLWREELGNGSVYVPILRFRECTTDVFTGALCNLQYKLHLCLSFSAFCPMGNDYRTTVYTHDIKELRNNYRYYQRDTNCLDLCLVRYHLRRKLDFRGFSTRWEATCVVQTRFFFYTIECKFFFLFTWNNETIFQEFVQYVLHHSL